MYKQPQNGLLVVHQPRSYPKSERESQVRHCELLVQSNLLEIKVSQKLTQAENALRG